MTRVVDATTTGLGSGTIDVSREPLPALRRLIATDAGTTTIWYSSARPVDVVLKVRRLRRDRRSRMGSSVYATYVVWRCDPPAVEYVGSTGVSVRERMKQHRIDRRSPLGDLLRRTRGRGLMVAWIDSADRADASALERELIVLLAPRVNINGKNI